MAIREKLQKGDVLFGVKGITVWGKNPQGEYDDILKPFRVSENSQAIFSNFDGMNVTKWGPTCVTLYTFDMLGRKSVGKINYKDVIIFEEE